MERRTQPGLAARAEGRGSDRLRGRTGRGGAMPVLAPIPVRTPIQIPVRARVRVPLPRRPGEAAAEFEVEHEVGDLPLEGVAAAAQIRQPRLGLRFREPHVPNTPTAPGKDRLGR